MNNNSTKERIYLGFSVDTIIIDPDLRSSNYYGIFPEYYIIANCYCGFNMVCRYIEDLDILWKGHIKRYLIFFVTA